MQICFQQIYLMKTPLNRPILLRSCQTCQKPHVKHALIIAALARVRQKMQKYQIRR